ncbi:hypothetical protein ACWCPS_33255 [Streptomyces mauvecolor]
MTAIPTPVLAVLGPPAEKTTMAEAITGARAATVFRVREAAHRAARTDPVIAAALESTSDPLGWLPDLLAQHLVCEALDAAPDRWWCWKGSPGTGFRPRPSTCICVPPRPVNCAVSLCPERGGMERIVADPVTLAQG